MESARWARVRAVFEAASEEPAGARAAFVAASCGGDEELRAGVEEMLRASGELGAFLEHPAEDVAAPPPARIGPYAVVRELGRGGMGTVYLASRADAAYRKDVAIKLIRPGMDSEAVLRRFAAERQILAALDHPNIARLFDAGTTPEGLPYFVMEYIEGEPLDVFCERRRPALRERLAIFRQVCDAVDEAHRKLVLHRDLKPGNILVDERGTPKLLDFGIAKLLAAEGGGELTELGVRPMTPEYASPEQLRGEPLTTASDVYSLGVVLYELLTGRLPASPVAVRPSLAGEGRVAALAGDLDNIALTALRQEPALRYASAARLGEDIDRYLAGRPVRARPPTVAYRARKFVGRHRVGVAAAAAVVASLLAGSIALTLQWRTTQFERARAERRFGEVRDLASAFVFEFDQAIRDLPGSTPARALVVRRGLQYLDRLAAEASGDQTLLAELAAAYDQLGDLQGGFRAANLGDSAGALASYRKALALREGAVAAPGAPAAARAALGRSHARVGALLFSRGESRPAHDHLARAVATLSGIEPLPREALIEALIDLGYLLENRADFQAAVATYEQAEALEPPSRALLIKLWSRKARALSHVAGRRAEALELERRAVDLAESAAAAAPENPALRWTAMMQHAVLGILEHESGNADAARDHYAIAIAAGEPLLAADPENAQWRYDLALCYALLGHDAEPPEALRSLRRAQSLAEPLLARDPEDMDVVGMIAMAEAGLAKAHAGLGQCAEAIAWLARAQPTLRRLEEKQVLGGWERLLPREAAAVVERCATAPRPASQAS